MLQKLNLVQEHRAEYSTPKSPQLIEVGPGSFLTVEGKGSPDDAGFAKAMSALYGAVYSIKMTGKKQGRDFYVAPLEGLWWVEGDPEQYLVVPRSEWRWKLLIRVPDFVEQADLARAREDLCRKGKGAGADEVRLERLEEGLCVQALHTGCYASEPETQASMSAFVHEAGLAYRGLHHEIYMSDPRRTAPDRLRTILRHPVETVQSHPPASPENV